jgi:hypothetical protein
MQSISTGIETWVTSVNEMISLKEKTKGVLEKFSNSRKSPQLHRSKFQQILWNKCPVLKASPICQGYEGNAEDYMTRFQIYRIN